MSIENISANYKPSCDSGLCMNFHKSKMRMLQCNWYLSEMEKINSATNLMCRALLGLKKIAAVQPPHLSSIEMNGGWRHIRGGGWYSM